MAFNHINGFERWLSFFLVIITISALGLAVVQGCRFAYGEPNAAAIENNPEDANQPDPNDPNDLEAALKVDRERAEALKKKNLYAPPPPKQHPVRAVDGIIGDEVLINHKFYAEGDEIGDAEIISIRPTEVVIEWDGKRKTFSPYNERGSGGGSPGGPPSRMKERPGGPDMRARPSPPGPRPNPGEMAKMRAAFEQMSRAEQEAMKEKLKNMSDEERAAFMRRQMK